MPSFESRLFEYRQTFEIFLEEGPSHIGKKRYERLHKQSIHNEDMLKALDAARAFRSLKKNRDLHDQELLDALEDYSREAFDEYVHKKRKRGPRRPA